MVYLNGKNPEKKNFDFLEKSDLDLAVIGNCSFNALINKHGRIVWCCLPRFDSDPIFCRLLTGDEKEDRQIGYFDVLMDNFVKSEQYYKENTAILVTRMFDKDGNILKIIDFAPRFSNNGRMYCHTQIFRLLFNEKGSPMISIRLRPVSNYGSKPLEKSFGSNHVSFYSEGFNSRMTTDVPIDFIEKEVWFLLNQKRVMIFGSDESFREDIWTIANSFMELTTVYWETFTKQLKIPMEWQKEVIRAAITLKMCQVQSSGAIVAAMTSSIPESAHSQRNWDYRFCWLRDSYHIVQALNRLGATCTMENYINFIANIIKKYNRLQPLYGVLMEEDIKEKDCKHLKGYRGQGPVRIGNEAYKQLQNDNYGNIILSVLLIFYDQRLSFENYDQLYSQLENIGEEAFRVWDVPDAGIWEFRFKNQVHTLSSVFCWTCCDRLSGLAKHRGLGEENVSYWREKADHIKKEILQRAWNEEKQCFMASLRSDKDEGQKEHSVVDASVLLLARLKFIDPKDERFIKTVRTIEKELVHNGFCFRYLAEDDFGKPENSFIICTFWYIEALALIGEKTKARKLFKDLLRHGNHVGLFSEDLNHETRELWGNFPQAYSMVGIINTAAVLSESWDSVGF